jgi:osmotically inducible lipoprotein OsmB
MAMKKILMISTVALSLGACATEQGNRAATGAVLGGAAGAVIGGAATGRGSGALAGAAIGAAGGAVVGAATTPRRGRDCYYDAYGRRVCDYY